jgi:hypothetical protein
VALTPAIGSILIRTHRDATDTKTGRAIDLQIDSRRLMEFDHNRQSRPQEIVLNLPIVRGGQWARDPIVLAS